jgi:glycolate oxidase FAD binding subunit
MKNVAGYDVSRLMAGSMGTLGVLLEVSLKVLPKAETEITQQLGCTAAVALDYLHVWAKNPIPVTASSYHDNKLNIRLSGTANAVMASAQIIGGDTVEEAATYWHRLKEQQLDFFKTGAPLWRLSIASDTSPSELETLGPGSSHVLYEWGGALRWVTGNMSTEQVQQAAAKAGGHATLFRNNGQPNQINTFQALSPAVLRIHRNLKQAFDPNGILNPGKLYPEL